MQWVQKFCEERNIKMHVTKIRSQPDPSQNWATHLSHIDVEFHDFKDGKPVEFDASILHGKLLRIDQFITDASFQQSDPAIQPRVINAVLQHPQSLSTAILQTEFLTNSQLDEYKQFVEEEARITEEKEKNDPELSYKMELMRRRAVVEGLNNLGVLFQAAAELIEENIKDEES